MKKTWILALAVCAALCAGALVADSAVEADTSAHGIVLADGLPGTVFDGVAAGPFAQCPRPGVYCLDVWDPVTCDNGVTYSNACYAYRACATGCVPGYPTS